MRLKAEQNYVNLRSREYPPIGDQLDAIFKMAKRLSELGVDIPIETQQWINDCKATKEKYAKNNASD